MGGQAGRASAHPAVSQDADCVTQFTVIVPAFNAQPTIVAAIKSVLAQTWGDYEVIVVDDCSTDGTVETVRSQFADDPRIKLLQMPVNGGPSAARNVGMGAATGDWIALLDADDAWRPDRLEMLGRHMSAADFVADNILAYDDHLKSVTGTFYAHRYRSAGLTLSALFRFSQNFDFGYLKPAMRRAFLETHGLKYLDDVRHGEDLLLYGSALCRGARFVLIEYAGYVYTTPIGMQSGAASAHSKTVSSGFKLADRVCDLERQLRPSAPRRDAQAIRRRARDIRGVLMLSEFLKAVRRGDGAEAARVAMAAPYIFYMIARYILPNKLARLIYGPDHVFSV